MRPGRTCATWAGACSQLITAASAHRIAGFLSVAWPAVTETCARPLESLTWLTAVQAVTLRCGADLARLAGMGVAAFIALVRAGVGDWGGKKAHGPIIARIFAGLTDTEGVVAPSRRGLLRRLEELGLSRLAGIPGLTAVGAAAILAETGGPRRYDTSSSLVKHSGMSPSGNASGAFHGQVRISRRGRPGLRLASGARCGRCFSTTR